MTYHNCMADVEGQARVDTGLSQLNNIGEAAFVQMVRLSAHASIERGG